MKVLLLTTHLNIGGVTSYTVNLARGLLKKNIKVFIASSGGELVETLKKEGIPHLLLNIKTKCEFHPKLFPAFLKLLTFIKENNITVIHAQTRVAQILAYFISNFCGTAYISTCHGFFKNARLGRKLLGAWGDYTIAISDAVEDHLIKDFKLKKEKVFLIYTGVDCEKFSRVIGTDEKGRLKESLGFEKAPIIGSITRLSPVKGLRHVLFAMKDILEEVPKARLLLVGEGPSKEYLMELARRLGIVKNVFFALSTTDTRRFLSIIDIFVFYSLQEGLGLSLLEAMAAGKPCVASNVGGVSSVLEDGVTGLLVPSKETHPLKEAIVKLLKNEKLRNEFAERGRALVKEKFSLDGMTKQVMEVYSRALKK
ncbi:MAG: glycosyltransferase family 4 protein [Candidatus Omnitrophota bacterium]